MHIIKTLPSKILMLYGSATSLVMDLEGGGLHWGMGGGRGGRGRLSSLLVPSK